MPFDPVAILLIDIPDVEEGITLSWRDLAGFPKAGYRRARVYLCHAGVPYAKLSVDLDDQGFPLESFPGLPRAARGNLAAGDPLREWPSNSPLVTVIVSTSGSRPDLLERCIKSLRMLMYPAFEIVVIDNRPPSITDESEDVWTDTGGVDGVVAKGVTIVREERLGLSFARNAGVLAARGEIVAFTDDDVEVDANWLGGIVNAFDRSPEVMCVTGLVVPAELETEAQEFFENYYGGFERGLVPRTWIIPNRSLRNRPFLSRSSFFVSESGSPEPSSPKSLYVLAGNCGVGANMAVRREIALRFPFDVALGAGSIVNSGEDTRFFVDVLWAGHAIAYVPSSIVRHTHRRDMDGLKIQIRRMGMGLTALLTSLIVRDARHLVGIVLGGGPSAPLRWTRSAISGQSVAEGRDQRRSYPSTLRRTELVGQLLGPWRYFLSRRHLHSLERASVKREPGKPFVEPS
jgi:hypothetical protein